MLKKCKENVVAKACPRTLAPDNTITTAQIALIFKSVINLLTQNALWIYLFLLKPNLVKKFLDISCND